MDAKLRWTTDLNRASQRRLRRAGNPPGPADPTHRVGAHPVPCREPVFAARPYPTCANPTRTSVLRLDAFPRTFVAVPDSGVEIRRKGRPGTRRRWRYGIRSRGR